MRNALLAAQSKAADPAGLVANDPAEATKYESWLSVTNLAYDCLSDFQKFRLFQKSGRPQDLPPLEQLQALLGEAQIKPLPESIRARREARAQEKVERLIALAGNAVRQKAQEIFEAVRASDSGHGKLPDSDDFYQTVYKQSLAAGKAIRDQELDIMSRSKLPVDATTLSVIDEELINAAEIAAHMQYDHLEDLAAARSERPNTKNRAVALGLTIVISGLVAGYALLANMQAPSWRSVAGAGKGAVAGFKVPDLNQVTACESYNITPRDKDTPLKTLREATAFMSGTAGGAGLAGPTTKQSQAANAYTAGLEAISQNHIDQGMAFFKQADIAGRGEGGFCQARYNQGALNLQFLEFDRTITLLTSMLNEKIIALVAGNKGRHPVSTIDSGAACFAQGLYNRGLAHQQLAERQLAGDGPLSEAARLDAIGHLRKAAKNYQAALDLDPQMAQAAYNKALAAARLGEQNEARDDFNRALKIDEDMDAARYNLEQLSGKGSGAAAPLAPLGPVGPMGP